MVIVPVVARGIRIRRGLPMPHARRRGFGSSDTRRPISALARKMPLVKRAAHIHARVMGFEIGPALNRPREKCWSEAPVLSRTPSC